MLLNLREERLDLLISQLNTSCLNAVRYILLFYKIDNSTNEGNHKFSGMDTEQLAGNLDNLFQN